MNNENGKIWFSIGLDNSQLQADAAKASAIIKGIGNSAVAESARIDNTFKRMAAAAGAAFTVQQAFQFARSIAEVRGQFQQLSVAFTTLLQSKEKADRLMVQMVELAAKTPFKLTDVASGAKQLIAYGFQAEEIKETLTRLGNVASGLGLPLERLTYLYGTTMTQGRLFSRDLMQFTSSGIPMLQGLADQFGVSTSEVQKLVEAGKVGFPEVEKVFESLTNQGGKFYNLMEEQSKTITGLLSNLGDAWDVTFNKIGQDNEGLIVDTILGTKYMVENYEMVGKAILSLIAVVGVNKAAVMALSTVSTIAAEKDILFTELSTAAKIKQIAITKGIILQQKLLNATMLSNPLVFMATALAAVTAVLWSMQDSTTSAEKALKRYNDLKQETIELEKKHKDEVTSLISTILEQTSADIERVKALELLKEKYPSIFSQYDVEKFKLADILDIKKKISEIDAKQSTDNAAKNISKQQAVIDNLESQINTAKGESFQSQGTANYITSLEKRLEVERAILDKFNDETQKDKIAAFVSGLSKMNTIQLQQEAAIREKAINEASALPFPTNQIIEGGLPGSYSVEQLKEQTRALEIELEKRNVSTYTYSQLHQKYIDELANAEKEFAELQKKNLSTAEWTKELTEAEEKIKDAKSNLDNIEGKKKVTKGDVDYQALKAQVDKDRQEQIREAKDFSLAVEQAKIDGMEEGLDKRLAQNQLNYEKELEQITRLQADLLEKQKQRAKADFESDPKNAGKKYTGADTVQLSPEQLKAFGDMTNEANNKYAKSTTAIWDDLLKEYQTYTDKRKAIDEKYNSEIETLKYQGYGEQAAEAERQKQDELNALDLEIAKRESTFDLWVNRIMNLGLDKLKETLSEANQMLDSGNLDDNSKAVLRAKIATLTAQIKATQAKESDMTDSEKNNKQWGDTLKTMNQVKEAVDNIVNSFDGLDEATKSALSAASNIAGGVIGMITGIQALAVTGAAAIKSVEKASVILAIIGAAIQVVSAIMNLINKGEKEHEQALQDIAQRKTDMQREYNKLLFEQNLLMTDSYSIFGVDELTAVTNAISLYISESEKLKNLLNDTSISKVFDEDDLKAMNEAYEKGVAGLQGIMIKTGEKQNSIWQRLQGSGKYTDEYTSLLSLYPDLIDSEGKLNSKRLESILATENLTEEQRNYLEGVQDTQLAIDEATDKINQYYEKLLAGLASDAIAAMVKSIKDGSNALENFGKTGVKVFETLAEQIIYQMFLMDAFNQLSADLMALRNLGLSPEDLAKRENEILNDFFASIGQMFDDGMAWMDMFRKIAAEHGFDLWSPDTEASKKGFAAMSQDSADELNGRFTALQAHTSLISESVRTLVINSNQALLRLAGIETNTAQLVRLERIENSLISAENSLISVQNNIYSVKQGIDTLNTKGITLKN
jgi:tape measure domain-containing protein